jgi:hypothetical protein
MADGQVVAPAFQLVEQVCILGGNGGIALGDAQVVVSCTVLTNVLICRAIPTMLVGGEFGE